MDYIKKAWLRTWSSVEFIGNTGKQSTDFLRVETFVENTFLGEHFVKNDLSRETTLRRTF